MRTDHRAALANIKRFDQLIAYLRDEMGWPIARDSFGDGDALLLVSNCGVGDERQISFAHFSKALDGHDLPTLKVLGWDNLDTALRLDAVAKELTEHLAWPEDDADLEAWRQRWSGAFVLRHCGVVHTTEL